MAWSRKQRFKRYKPGSLSYATVYQACCRSATIGNGSKGGPAFEYTPLDEFDDLRERNVPPTMDSVVGEAPLLLPRVPCEALYDFEVTDQALLAGSVTKRCCVLKFTDLSEEQSEGLDVLLQGHVGSEDRSRII